MRNKRMRLKQEDTDDSDEDAQFFEFITFSRNVLFTINIDVKIVTICFYLFLYLCFPHLTWMSWKFILHFIIIDAISILINAKYIFVARKWRPALKLPQIVDQLPTILYKKTYMASRKQGNTLLHYWVSTIPILYSLQGLQSA